MSEHCDHEAVCHLIWQEMMRGWVRCERTCSYDTRPHPEPEQCEYPEDCRSPVDCPETRLARKDERAKVLETLETYVRTDHSLNRQIGKRIMIAKIQSLREGDAP